MYLGTQRRDQHSRPSDGSTPRISSSAGTLGTQLPIRKDAREGCHGATAIIALTHDPRIDDLAMMEAVRTPAFYIGVMGSKRTSKNRAERLARSGGLSPQQIARIRMPIGMDLGSKTPAQIALSAMADILGTFNGKL
ncbi:XdhC family protein [Marinobacterium sedimentorum]|uniref:XdhC family protein n=1 Tax=Marinobacterium sedimentorum TaxID=2927804 RepID=UPI003F656C6C